MRKRLFFLFLTLGLGLAACSGPTVKTEHNRTVKITRLSTYAWSEAPGRSGPGVPRDPTLEMRIQMAVNQTLEAKGFRKVPKQNADLILEYEVLAEEKADSMELKNKETAEFMGLTYTLGTLTLTMKQASSSDVVAWQGKVQAQVDMSRSLDERDAKMRQAVQKLLEKFPPD